MWWESTPRAASWKPHADGLVGHLEVVPALRAAGPHLLERPLEVVERDQRRVGLVVGAGAVALDRVRLLRDLPLELHLGHVRRARQHHLDAVPGRLEVAEVDEAGLRRAPLARERAAAGVAADVRVGALVVHARRDDPACTCRRSRASAAWAASTLFHGWCLSTGLPSGSCVTNVSSFSQSSKYELPSRIRIARLISTRSVVISSPSITTPGRDVALAAPLGHVPVVVVDVVRVVERAPADEVRLAVADHVVARQRLGGRSRRGRRASARCA